MKKRRFAAPHVYIILMALIFLCGLLSYVIPAGEYATIVVDGHERIDAGQYHRIESTPVTLMQMLSALPRGLTESAQIIFFVLIVGGAFAILQETGAIEAGIGRVIQLFRGKTLLLLPVILLLFMLGGAIFGMSEETLPFVPIFVSMCIAMGYDSITGTALVFCGSAAGYAGAFMNPFTVQVAQGIAGLPLLSGLSFRVVMFVVYYLVTASYLLFYARRVQRDAEASSMHELDSQREDLIDLKHLTRFDGRKKAVLCVFVLSIGLLVAGVIHWDWYIDEIAALFIGMAIAVALAGRMSPNQFAENFAKGVSEIASSALVIGFARGVLVVLTDGHILHTILFSIASLLEKLPSIFAVLGMYILQCLLNFLVPSGSGQAAVSLPILVPLGDLAGVTRQTVCIAYQLGDAISNAFSPTVGGCVAGLALAKIPWAKWMKWILPLVVIQYAIGAIFLIIAHTMGLGPF